MFWSVIAFSVALAPLAGQSIESHATFRGLLGQTAGNTYVQNTVRSLGDYRVEKLDATEAEYYYSFAQRGIEIHFSEKHAVDFIVLMNTKAFDLCEQYSGSLPEDLTFSDTEEAVRQKLGEPGDTEVLAGEQERVLFYESKGFSVVLHTAPAERAGQIKYVELYPAEEKQ
jgi:hypothetical protein